MVPSSSRARHATLVTLDSLIFLNTGATSPDRDERTVAFDSDDGTVSNVPNAIQQ